jgi:hydroxymethylpyrimidine pyrophosphatase-like HAD family hydrolase
MELGKEHLAELEHFFNHSDFSTAGALITDLDGTAVHEFEGRTIIHQSVETGLKKIYNMGRPVILNTLRFPLSVIRTFAKDWYLLSNGSIPVILLNGSQLGYITKDGDEFAFEQLASFTLLKEEIQGVLDGVKRLMDAKANDFILFYYPEDWRNGEIIWTPVSDKIPYLQDKYKSASSVISTDLAELKKHLLAKPICMIFLLIEIPQDQLMAYQHTKRSNFVTRQGVDKLYGSVQMSKQLNFDLLHSIGAGDSEMDTFLDGVGLSIHVGNPALRFKGKVTTMKLPGFPEFGSLLHQFADRKQALMK